jgi:hypothetical protein
VGIVLVTAGFSSEKYYVPKEAEQRRRWQAWPLRRDFACSFSAL